MEINSTKSARPYIWKTNQPLCFFYRIYNLQWNLYAKTCKPTTTVTLYSKRLTLSATDTENRGKVKNAKPKKSKEMCPYCLGRKHQFCTLCKEAGLRLKRWAGGKMNDNLAPTKSGMNVTGGWVQEVHLVKTQKSVCGRAIPSPDLLHRWLCISHGWEKKRKLFFCNDKTFMLPENQI